jgi:hypothetical protein
MQAVRRRLRPYAVLLPAVVVGAMGGCFSPSYPTCAFSCGPRDSCPEGYSCDPIRKRCCRGGAITADRGRDLFSNEGPLLDRDRDRWPAREAGRELVARWDTDADWASGQALRTKPSSGALQLTLPPASVTGGPKTVSDADTGASWCHYDTSKPGNCDPDLAVLAQGTSIFSGTSQVGDLTKYLYVKPSLSQALPAFSIVAGVRVDVSRKPSGTVDEFKDEAARLLVGSTPSGDNKKNPSFWPAGYQSVTYGGSSDLWGLALDAATVNGTGFGFAFRAHNYYAGADTAWVQSVQMTVTYADGSGEWLSPVITLTEGAMRWDAIETKQDAPGCPSGAITYDVVRSTGAPILQGVTPSPVIDLAGVTDRSLRVRALLHTASKSCVPAVDWIAAYQIL